MRIKNIIFDLGGVVIIMDQQQAVNRFKEIGLTDAEQRLDPYTQKGIFGDLEEGRISAEEFRDGLSKIIGRDVTMEQCEYAWRGYIRGVPLGNLHALERLHGEGYRLLLLSNTNPFIQHWANSPRFSPLGKGLWSYFDDVYLSYRMRVMKPDEQIFRQLLMKEKALPAQCLFVDDGARNCAVASQVGMRTFCPRNGGDWTEEIYTYLRE